MDSAVVDLLTELVSIDSVNPGLVPGAAGESAAVAMLRDRLDRAGFETHIVVPDGHPNRPSLVAIGPERAGARTVVFNGHLDTVGIEGMPNALTPRIDGDRLYGRGAADMKGGVAALVVAAEHLVATGAPVRPVLALVADEEDASLGSEAVIAALPNFNIHPDVCLIAEPTGLALCRSLRGFGVARVTFPGRAAHSSQAEQGVNAVTHLGRFLEAVDRHAPSHREVGGDLMVTLARGGSSAFVVPDSAECLLELRTLPEGRGSDVVAIANSLLHPEWNARVDHVASRDGWRIDATGAAATLADALGTALGTTIDFDAPYWMEAPLWQQVCPTVICGPTGDGLHSIDEWVDLDQVRRFTHALVEVLGS